MTVATHMDSNNIHALIDADRLAYSVGKAEHDDGSPLIWDFVVERIDTNIQNQLQGSGASTRSLYLTSDDKSNFRFRVATIRTYKGNRSSEKPFWYEHIRRFLVDEYQAEIVFGMEADDRIGIEQCTREPGSTVICSVDKDLDMIPGKHFNELKPERGVYEISETTGLRNFYGQLLCGDSTDNIPGLYGVGRSSKLLDHLNSMDQELAMYAHVRAEYEKRFGNHWEIFLLENMKLLWIKRSEELPTSWEISQRQFDLEKQRLDSEAALKIA